MAEAMASMKIDAAAWLIASVLVTIPTAARSVSDLLNEAVGLPGYAMFLESGAPGMILAVVHQGDEVVVGYGETAKGSGQEPNGSTLVRIGSVSKVFTGELLARLAAVGRVRLTGSVRNSCAGHELDICGAQAIWKRSSNKIAN
jgi:serine-type D-Ala-D-Ala carboxypeptidase/endopeptidase